MKSRCLSASQNGSGVTCRLNSWHSGPHKYWGSLPGYREKWADVEGACVLCAKGLLDVDGVHRVGNDTCRCASPAYAARETLTQRNAREELRAECECRKTKR